MRNLPKARMIIHFEGYVHNPLITCLKNLANPKDLFTNHLWLDQQNLRGHLPEWAIKLQSEFFHCLSKDSSIGFTAHDFLKRSKYLEKPSIKSTSSRLSY